MQEMSGDRDFKMGICAMSEYGSYVKALRGHEEVPSHRRLAGNPLAIAAAGRRMTEAATRCLVEDSPLSLVSQREFTDGALSDVARTRLCSLSPIS